MNIFFHRNFEKDYLKLRTPEKAKVKERIGVFAGDPFEPTLENHALKGKYEGYRSIRIGGDLRTVYKIIGRESYLFVAIGTHAKLYSS